MTKKFGSVLDQIAEIIERDTGEKPYTVEPSKDRIHFQFPEELTKPMHQQLAEATQPVGGLRKTRIEPNDKQFGDENKQLQLPASSTIQQASYWPKKEYLVVSFKSGHTYDYSKVPLITMIRWEQATSAGSYFYYNIRMSYRYRKMG